MSMSDEMAEPLAFPDPVIYSGTTGFIKIQSGDSFKECPALLSSLSGRVYECGQVIKNALFGEVMVGALAQPVNEEIYCRSADYVAIKKICSDKLADPQLHFEDPMKEIAALQFFDDDPNPHLVRIYECLYDGANYYTVMEFCSGGTFSDLLASHNKFTETKAIVFFSHIVAGLLHMKSHGVCHRDLSLQNLVLSGDGVCKIIDLGMALRVPYEECDGCAKFFYLKKQGACGKPNYMAPEVFNNEEPLDTFKADIWALGVILFAFLAGRPPCNRASENDEIYRFIRDGNLTQLMALWKIEVSENIINLLVMMLQVDPKSRPSLEQIWEYLHS